MGSWFAPEGSASGFHDVYTEPRTIEYCRANGRFPDGATLVKELRVSDSGDYMTGTGVNHSTKNIKQWFVMIKDSEERFGDNPLWGEGWDWALYKPDAPAKNLAKNYASECLGCHVPAKQNDWIYVEGYPILFER